MGRPVVAKAQLVVLKAAIAKQLPSLPPHQLVAHVGHCIHVGCHAKPSYLSETALFVSIFLPLVHLLTAQVFEAIRDNIFTMSTVAQFSYAPPTFIVNIFVLAVTLRFDSVVAGL